MTARRTQGRTGQVRGRRISRRCVVHTQAALALCLLLVAHATSATILRAQTPAPESTRAPTYIRHGKWAALGLAAGFTVLGAETHDRADQRYRELLAYCRSNGTCAIGTDGRYASASAEHLYQLVVQSDRSARAWLIGGQAAMVAGAVLFVIELNRERGPKNIPFAPFVSAGRFGAKAGVRIEWGRMGRLRTKGEGVRGQP